MKTFIYSLFVMMICLMGVYSSTSRNYSFPKDSALEREFDNVYYALEHFKISPTEKLWLDGGDDTYMSEYLGNHVDLVVGGVTIYTIDTGHFVVNVPFLSQTAGAYNIGSAANYFGVVHCTDIIDYSRTYPKDNVKNALLKIDIEDKATYPTDVYIQASRAKTDIYKNNKLKYKKGDKMGTDGISLSQLIAYLIEYSKELEQRIIILEQE